MMLTFCHCSDVQCRWAFAQANLFFFICFVSRGFLIALLTLLPPSLSLRRTVWTDKWVLVSRLMSSAVSLGFFLLALTTSRSCWTPDFRLLPHLPTRKVVEHPVFAYLLTILCTDERGIPVTLEISRIDRPASVLRVNTRFRCSGWISMIENESIDNERLILNAGRTIWISNYHRKLLLYHSSYSYTSLYSYHLSELNKELKIHTEKSDNMSNVW